MSQTEYQIKPGNITSNSEETSSISKVSCEIQVAISKKIKGEFDNVAQGDWVKKAKNELDDISKKLKNIQRTEV